MKLAPSSLSSFTTALFNSNGISSSGLTSCIKSITSDFSASIFSSTSATSILDSVSVISITSSGPETSSSISSTEVGISSVSFKLSSNIVRLAVLVIPFDVTVSSAEFSS